LQRQQIIAKKGEAMSGEKFQKYLVSLKNRKAETTYTERDKVKVFSNIEEAFEMIKLLLNTDEYGWYALDYDRWNEGRG